MNTTLPNAIEEERAVLGAMLLEKTAYVTVLPMLKSENFFSPEHKIIFQAIENLYRNSWEIDLLTVTDELKRMGKIQKVGGPAGLTELTMRVSSSANIEYHAVIIREKWMQRQLSEIGQGLSSQALNEEQSPFDLLGDTEKKLHEITASSTTGAISSEKAVRDTLKKLESVDGKTLLGIGSGFPLLDNKTNGWKPGNLIILAGRPGMGKTSAMLKHVRQAAIVEKKSVYIASYEMTAEELVCWMIAQESQLNLTEIMRGIHMNNPNFQQAYQRIYDAKITIDTRPGNFYQLKAKLTAHKWRNGLDMSVWDYVQMMPKTDRRQQKIETVSEAAQGAKEVAKELEIPIILLSQLSREPDKRSDKRPQLSDLKETGDLEQAADVVLFPFRPAYYELKDEGGNSYPDSYAEYIIGKHRGGAIGEIEIYWKGSTVTYSPEQLSIFS